MMPKKMFGTVVSAGYMKKNLDLLRLGNGRLIASLLLSGRQMKEKSPFFR
jgi:hypothetical protein